jgi:Fic family protein
MVAWLSARILLELGSEPYLYDALKATEEHASQNLVSSPGLSYGNLTSILKKIDGLKKEIDALRAVDSYKVAQFLELEYTYHSNKIEGNTLTLAETELVVSQGLTISGKSMREHLEAINHTEAIAYMRDLVKEKKPVTERLIQSLHAIVLRGIDRENAGIYRKVQVRIGGSSHTPPDAWLVPVQMEELIRWYNLNKQLHPVVLAAEMHQRLVSIHPFIDGNGRTSRLLMNLILLQNGYPLAIIKGDTSERLKYYESLDSSRSENEQAFISFIATTELKCSEEYLRILRGA